MRRLILIAALIIPSIALSNGSVQNAFKIQYGSKAWNQSGTTPDSAFAFIKDKTTGKIVKVVLDETEPDSSVFSGVFSVNWGNDEVIKPEVYIPPEKMKDDPNAIKNFNSLLRSKKIKRKPLLFKKNDSGLRVLDVYDTKEQVLQAAESYKKELKARRAAKAPTKPIPDEATMEVARQAAKEDAIQKAKMDALEQEKTRLRQEQLEQQRLADLLKKQQMLASKEKARRKARAKKLAERALKYYVKGNYEKAEELFKKSNELDPENSSHYFKYGVTLYKNEKYSEALVILKLSKTVGQEEIEKAYYMGLTHFRLKELDSALEKFKFCKDKSHPIISPSAAFYEGLILFTLEHYKKSQASFEYVLDNSKDPKMDNKAEEYVEKIANILRFKNLQNKKNDISATLGTSYDSNVLQASDAAVDQGSPTGASMRGLLSFNYSRRWIYQPKHEFSTKLTTMTMYSTETAARISDPSLTSINLPYSYKGKAFGKGYKFTWDTGYEVLFMDLESAGVQTNILNGLTMNFDNTFIMNQNWFASYGVDIRQDDSLISVTDAADNADASKITLKTTQSYFLDKTKKRGVITNFSYATNTASGDNKTYSRIDLGSTYMAPLGKWGATWTTGLSLYNLAYSTTDRKDNNITLNGSLSKSFKEWMTGALTASYSTNSSNQDSYNYSKYTIMATLTMTHTF